MRKLNEVDESEIGVRVLLVTSTSDESDSYMSSNRLELV